MKWLIKLLKKMFCCATLDCNVDENKKLLKNSSIRSNDEFPIYSIYNNKESFSSDSFTSISIAN